MYNVNDKRCIKTHNKIINAFLKLTTVKKYQDITVSELASYAGINRKTFYSHFCGVHAIVEELEDDLVTKITDIVKNIDIHKLLNNPYDFVSKINAVTTSKISFIEQISRMKSMGDFEKKIKDRVIHNIMEGIELPKRETIKLRDCLEFIFSGLVASIMHWINNREEETLEELYANISELLVYGAKHILSNVIK